MKKRALKWTALAITAMMPMTAAADVNLVKVANIPNGSLVTGTSLFRVQGSGGYGLTDMNGNALTGTIYGSSFWMEENFITASENVEGLNTQGLLDQSGKTVLPFQYGDLKVLNSRWAVGIVLEEATSDAYDYESWSQADVYYKISKADIYYLGDGAGKCLASLDRSQYMEARAYGEYINIKDRSTNTVSTYDSAFQQVETGLSDVYTQPEAYETYDTFEENGQRGLKDPQGNVVLAPAFKYINDGTGNYRTVSNGEKQGLIDIQGNILLDAQFDDIERNYYAPAEELIDDQTTYVAAGYVAVCQDGKVGFTDTKGNITFQPKYAESNVEVNGASATLTDLEGNTILIAADGVETVISDYEVRPLYYGSGIYYSIQDEDYNEGLMDWHGEIIVPCEYTNVELTGDGKYVYVEEDYESGVVYQLTYPEGAEASQEVPEAEASAQEETAPASEAPAQTEAAPEAPAQTEAVPEAPAQTEPAPETPAQTEAEQASEAPAQAPSGDTSAVNTLLDSAVTLLEAGEYSSVESMLNSAKLLLGEGQDNAAVLLDSAIALLKAETVDANSVATLLTSAKALL